MPDEFSYPSMPTTQKYPYESLFRSFNLTLIDNASSEYLFIVEFFAMDNEKAAADLAKNVFHDIFEPTEKMGLVSYCIG